MADFQKQIAKEGFLSANAKFIGLLEEPKTGNKDGKQWRKAKVSFHLDKKQNPNKFTIWTPLTSQNTKFKSDEELKPFNMYNIVWVEENQSYNGKEWVEKKILLIKEYDPNLNQSNTQNQNSQQNSVPAVKANDVFQFACTDYLNAVKKIVKEHPEEEKNLKVPTRMLGAVLNKAEPKLFAPLLKLCKEALDNFKV